MIHPTLTILKVAIALKFSKTVVLSDPEPPIVKTCKNDWKYEVNLCFGLFQLIHHDSSSLFKTYHYYLVIITLIWYMFAFTKTIVEHSIKIFVLVEMKIIA